MFCKLLFASFITLAYANQVQYPAGVNPHACPNYPVCDNMQLHGMAQAHGNMNMMHGWQAPANHWQGGNGGMSPAPVWQATQDWKQNDWKQNNWQNNDWKHNDWQEHNGGQQNDWQNNDWKQNDWQDHNGGHQNDWQDHNGGHQNGAGGDATGGDKFPAGVDPKMCPNYPYCDVNMMDHAGGGMAAAKAAPLPGWSERMYPAGVSAHMCPNFPFCH